MVLVSAVTGPDGNIDVSRPALVAGALFLGTSLLVLPSFTIISGDRFNYDNEARDAAYVYLIDILVDDSAYGPQMHCFGDNNPHIIDFIRSFTFNAWYVAQSFTDRLRIDVDRRFAFDLMLGWIARLYNEHSWVFPIVLLSLWALRCGVKKPFWRVLQRVRLLYAYSTTEQIALDVGDRVGNWAQKPEFFPEGHSRDVGIAVADNLQINFETKYEGCKEMGEGNFFYIFVTWLICALPLGTIPATFSCEGTHVMIKKLVLFMNP